MVERKPCTEKNHRSWGKAITHINMAKDEEAEVLNWARPAIEVETQGLNYGGYPDFPKAWLGPNQTPEIYK